MAFRLSVKFLEQYVNQQPAWGFGDLSYFTYKRTYARIMPNGLQEEYWNTCQRVTEGVFEAQRHHCLSNRLPWNAHKAQKTAQEFYQRMWMFKFTPPGRGFWIMGTPMVNKIGSAALNNPLHTSTPILTKEYGWIPIGRLEGQKVSVLSNTKLYGRDNSTAANAKWVEAQISHVEQQPSVIIKFKDKSGMETSIIASENHRWFRKSNTKNSWQRVTSLDLNSGDLIPRTRPPIYYKPCQIGTMHGFFFGDGTRSNGELHQFGVDNIDVLNKLFTNAEKLHPTSTGNSHSVVRQCPLAWGYLPSNKYLDDKRYLMGFLMGYFAADGCFTKCGSMKLSSARPQELLKVCSLFKQVGIATGKIKLVSTSSNYKDQRELWEVKINHRDIPEWFLLKRNHRENYFNRSEKFGHNYAWVISIEKLDVAAPVICATVPGYEQFVIDNFILTSNCGFTSTKDLKVQFGNSFSWAMDMLMLGVGVGFDTRGAGTIVIKEPRKNPILYVIPDSREGWVESVRLLLNSYQSGGNVVEFDYSLIRKKGAPIKGFGGTASGPQPLIDLHGNIRKMLTPLIGEYITSVCIVDIMNFIGKCVVAGNVRRSAELAIGEIKDADYVTMKDYTRYADELSDRRWASNNSVFANATSDFSRVAPNIALNGEPGLIFIDNARHYGRLKDGFHPFESERYDNVDGFNPCAEQCLEDKELCCLVETYPANHESVEDYIRTLKFAYLYAKTVTLIPTHDVRTNSVMMRNRRIGCSMSGIQQAIAKWGLATFLSDFCDKGYEEIRRWDRIFSKWLGIPRSVKMTTVKPSGTVSLLAGATPGVHCTHSEYYLRTVRVAGDSPLIMALIEAGYRVETSVNDRKILAAVIKEMGYGKEAIKAFETGLEIDPVVINEFGRRGGTVVVYFPVKSRNFAKSKSKFDISLWEQLSLVREMQHYWSDNAVSCTVTIKKGERKDLERAIEFFAPYVKTLSFLPLTGHNYKQAVYQECGQDHYDNYTAQLKSLDLTHCSESKIKGSKFCTNDGCL